MTEAKVAERPGVIRRATDGRVRRGEEARTRLLDATLRIIERDGLAGVTHRRVTAEAGLPATSAAYHFASITDLLEAALRRADDESAAALNAISRQSDPIAALAHWLVADFNDNQRRCVAEYELFLHAARTPSLRPAALRWLTDLTALVAEWTPDEDAQRRLCAYVDGLLVQSLVAGTIPSAAVIEGDLRTIADQPND
jgi:TetR/AcrR family transcriptional regulator, regulator of biofilm formation and stress response